MCLNGTPLGSVKMQSAQLPKVTEFKYLGNTLQSDGDMTTEINRRNQCGWNNWKKMSCVICDKRVPPHVKGKMHTTIVQPAMLYVMETVPVTSSHVKKLEVTEMKMCRWACGHTLKVVMLTSSSGTVSRSNGFCDSATYSTILMTSCSSIAILVLLCSAWCLAVVCLLF